MSQSSMHDCKAEAMHGWNRACYLLTVCWSSALSSLLSAEVLSLSDVTAPSGPTDAAWRRVREPLRAAAWMKGDLNRRAQGIDVWSDLEGMLFLRRPSMLLCARLVYFRL